MNTATELRKSLSEDGTTGSGHGHPSIETLRAYQKGLLPAAEKERIQDHFVFCRDCSETMLDLDVFFSKDPAPGRQDPEKLVAAWNDLVHNLDQAPR